jgi:ligand-binding sensor domain-containing protein
MKRIRVLGILAASAAIALAGTAGAQSRWINHVDVSSIREIVHRGDELFLATNGGLVIYNTMSESFTQYTNTAGLLSNDLTCLVFAPSGAIYVGSKDIGISKIVLSGGGIEILRSFNQGIDGLADNEVTSVTVFDDDIYYGTVGGAGSIVGDFPSALYRDLEGMPSNQVNDVAAVGDHLWMATDAGVATLDRLGLLRLPSGGPGDANVVGSDGELVFVGTSDGVWTLDPTDSSWTEVGPAGEAIFGFHHDGDKLRAGSTNAFWVYQGSGVWEENLVSSVYARYKINASASRMRGIVATAPDRVYLGTEHMTRLRGFNLLRADVQTNPDALVLTDLRPNAPGTNNIRRLSVDIDGSLWVSFASFYVGKLNPNGTWTNYNSTIPESDSLSSQFNNLACLADSDGYKWFCSLSRPSDPHPLDRLDDGLDGDYGNDEWEHYGIGSGGGDQLGSLRFQRAVEDPVGNRWFLADQNVAAQGWEGIHILSSNQQEWLQAKLSTTPMATGNVIDVAFSDTRAYVAMPEYGVQEWFHNGYDWPALSDLDGDLWRDLWRVTVTDVFVSSVEVTSADVVWIGTNDGLYRVSAFGDVRRFGAFTGFGVGLLSKDVSDLALDHDENLWVATSAGLNRISAEDENDIDAYSTAAEYQRTLIQLGYGFDVISPLVDSHCVALAVHPEDDVVYVGTLGGLSVFDFSPEVIQQKTLQASGVYLYPNPVPAGHNTLYVDNITGPVSVEVYTLEGELVDTNADVDPDNPEDREDGKIVAWDLTTRTGIFVASGVYVVRITSSLGTVVKTVSVIR